MTCGSKKHIAEALAKIHVHDKEDEIKEQPKRKERRKVTA